jgi:hypothetical protein
VTIIGDSITSLEGLSVLTSIGGSLYIYANDSLTNLIGLEGLTSIEGNLQIENNELLTSLNGIEGLTSIGGSLRIEYNCALTSLTGLEGLTTIGGGLSIAFNDSLTNLTGLENLPFIWGYLSIRFNDALTSLTGLEGLTSIWGSLEISYNNALTSLTGLDNIYGASIIDLYILNNSSLSTCDVQNICEYLADHFGNVYIYNNATGCNSQEEVEAACGVGFTEDINPVFCSVYPNPFTGQTTFSIQLQDQAQVNLVVFNNIGQVVATILDESLAKGNHQVTWNTEDFPPGIYFYRISTIGNRQTAIGRIMVM